MFLVKKTGVVFKDWTEITENTKQTGFFYSSSLPANVFLFHWRQTRLCTCELQQESLSNWLHSWVEVCCNKTIKEINMHIVYILSIYLKKLNYLEKKIHIRLCSWILITLFKDLPWLVMFKAEMNVSRVNVHYVQPPTFLSTEGI